MWCWSEGVSDWGIFGMVMMVVFWMAIIVLVVWGGERFTQGTAIVTSKGAQLDIARERYVKVEISN